MLIQPVGEGTTLLSLLDSTWRWRFRLGDTYFYRYWGQVLRTMTPHELPGDNRLVKLTADRESYLPEERVVLRARAAEIGAAMLGDVAHWRLATETRRLGSLG